MNAATNPTILLNATDAELFAAFAQAALDTKSELNMFRAEFQRRVTSRVWGLVDRYNLSNDEASRHFHSEEPEWAEAMSEIDHGLYCVNRDEDHKRFVAELRGL